MENNTNNSSFSRFAHMNTLTEEEQRELEAEEAAAVGSEQEYDEAEQEDGENTESLYAYEKTEEPASRKPRLVHTEPRIEMAAKPTQEDMFRFICRHTYYSVVGIIALVLGVASVVMFVYSLSQGAQTIQVVLFAAVAVMFIVNSPAGMWFRANKASRDVCSEGKVVTYAFSDAGLDMWRNAGEYASFTWDQVYKAIEGKTAFYIYVNKNQAFVLPKADLDSELDAFRTMVRKNTEKCIDFDKYFS